MSGPARAGALIYAKDLDALSDFYCRLLGMRQRVADAQHQVIESDDIQLIIHATPAHLAADIRLTRPPAPREDQTIKLFFTTDSLAAIERRILELGGGVTGPVYDGPGFKARNAFDCEGNVFHIRATGP